MKRNKAFFVLCASLLGVMAFAQRSLDQIDRASFGEVTSPLDYEASSMMTVRRLPKVVKTERQYINLSGTWILEGTGLDGAPVSVEATVPGSIHSALADAGVIPDPLIGANSSLADKCSYRPWKMIRRFLYDGSMTDPVLHFGGIANKCRILLNGNEIAEHEGMFGCPGYHVADYLRAGENVVEVQLDPIPETIGGGFPDENPSWTRTVVANCVYGWHYVRLPSLGIWREVELRDEADRMIENPFFITRTTEGDMRLVISLPELSGCEVKLAVTDADGVRQCYSAPVQGGETALEFHIDDPKLWWPNDMGPQNLYDAEISLVRKGRTIDAVKTKFGIRTIEMAPLPEGRREDKCEWTFVVNGHPMFVKGAGWCTMDALLDLSKERYERFLTLAKQQHIQMMRSWGGGVPETDEFYNLCDSLGIMIMQEWPTAWNSHKTQPYEMLKETVELNTLRIRNHPSLVMWGGGNESGHPYGEAIDMMGRASIALDGTRAFHRGEPYGGSQHAYPCWWGDFHLDSGLNLMSDFLGEFGTPSFPVMETTGLLYGDETPGVWPPADDSNIYSHLPTFHEKYNVGRLSRIAGYFVNPDSVDNMIFGTQICQAVAVRHTLEAARAHWPECTGALYYKMNDVYPGVSWSCVDWYGRAKPAHYFFQKSFEPVTSVLLFDRVNLCAQNVALPLFILDDPGLLTGKTVTVRVKAYDHNLEVLRDSSYVATPSAAVNKLGTFDLNSEETCSWMLYFVTELYDEGGSMITRNWYFTNFETRRGIMLEGPRAALEMRREGRELVISNVSDKPAIGVNIEVPESSDKLMLSDNFLWIPSGESVSVTMNDVSGKVRVTSFNCPIINE